MFLNRGWNEVISFFMDKMDSKEYKRNCPQCGREKIYKNEQHLNRAIEDNSLCHSCASKNAVKKKAELVTPEILVRRKENSIKYKKKYWKKYYEKNKDKINNRKREYRKTVESKEKLKEYRKKYGQTKKHKEVRKAYRKNRIQEPIYKLNIYISNDIRRSLRHKKISKNGFHWEDVLGYSVQDLAFYIEKKFKKNMTWDNYGEWQIDHIIPMSFFKYSSTDDVEFKMCWRLENLQPLWADENLLKKNKIYNADYYINLEF